MSDIDDIDGKNAGRLRARGSGPSDAGHVRQSFSHGRSKSVVVERKRRRVLTPREAALRKTAATVAEPEKKSTTEAEQKVSASPVKKSEPKPEQETAAPDASLLSEREYQRRMRALEQAKIDDKERIEREREQAYIRNKKAERQEAESTTVSKAAPRIADQPPENAPVKAAPAKSKKFADSSDSRQREDRESQRKQSPARKGQPDTRRRSGKLTISQALTESDGGRQRSLAAIKRRQEREKRKQMAVADEREKIVREVKIPDTISVQELANRMAERGADVIKKLMSMGVMATINEVIDADTAQLIVEEFGHRHVRVSESDVENILRTEEDEPSKMLPRPPVITVMGHVDHGKTSLLDALRDADVVGGESGGITQHIGAYQIKTKKGPITLIDTPGHAAFSAMRARGSQVTDLVILVVAADDAVMPQTVEAIDHAKAADVPIIVAINKMDSAGADPQKVRQQLLQHEVFVEKLGGEVLDVELSALKRQGLDALTDAILLQAELLELRANAERAAEGVIIEAKLDVGRGAVATLLIQRGTLREGDIFVVGQQWGRVRAMIDDKGKRITEAGPSLPVEVLGLQGTPDAGDQFIVVENEAKAREIAEYRQRKTRDKQSVSGTKATLDQLISQAQQGKTTAELPLVVKADVHGSVEAIKQALEEIGNEDVQVRILHGAVGAITESDVTLALASKAPVIGFNVRANAPAREAARAKGVELRYYSIIYQLVDDVKAAASGLLTPEIKEKYLGYADIKEVFNVSKVGTVAGCIVTEGLARKAASVRLLRDNAVIHEGKLATLKRFKDEVEEVRSGMECGMAFEKYQDIRVGDVIEIFESEEIARSL